ncbi:hypothetical Protein psc5_00110 [Candidatus Phytoplasma solani]
MTKEDLYQEGVLGLIKALDNYQDLGYDFIAYATPTIKSEIRELIRKSGRQRGLNIELSNQ